LRDPKLDLVSMKSKSSDGGILGLKKLTKRAKTLQSMSKSLTSGAGDLIGGVTNLSKDVINKLQRKNTIDEKKEEGDWWLE
jgi:hypothetical protein